MTALPEPSVALDDQLCFALYAASRAVTARYRPGTGARATGSG